jgi:hypothetical protein
MTDRVTIPREPTLSMCVAYMRKRNFREHQIANWIEKTWPLIGTPYEPNCFVSGLRAAIEAGAGVSLEEIEHLRQSRRAA